MGRLGDIFRTHAAEYAQRFAERMSLDQLRAMRAIERCHTPAAGAVLWRCSGCGRRHFTFQGCGNRHCPACGSADAAQWLERQRTLLLPGVTYHLVTFTVHGQLRRMIRSHPREGLEWLMRNAAATLLDICRNPCWIGGTPGVTAVLHTWTRQLEYHPHVHFIVTGGGFDEGGRWHAADPKFLVPVHALSNVFRARMRDALKAQSPERFAQIPARVWRDDDWVVHSKPVGSGEKAYEYLARYVYRVAVSEQAILGHTDNQVIIRYRTSDTNQPRTLRLEPIEFMRRFLQHVLPSRFCKVRHYGLHHSSKRPLLKRIQAALAILHNQPLPETPLTEKDHSTPQCPECRTPMRFDRRITPSQWDQGFGILPLHHQRAPP